MTDTQTIISALRKVNDPELHQDIVSLNMVLNVSLDSGKLAFEIVEENDDFVINTSSDNQLNFAVKLFSG